MSINTGKILANRPWVWVVVVCAGISACAAAPQSHQTEAVPLVETLASTSSDLVARDFASAIVQITERPPAQITLQFNANDKQSVYLRLQEELAEAGFQVTRDADDQRSIRVQHWAQDLGIEGVRALQHEISIGNIGLRRAYATTEAGAVVPVTGLFVRGADPSVITPSDAIIFGSQEQFNEPSNKGEFLEVALLGRAANTNDNRLVLGRSNYHALFTLLESVQEHVVPFGRGSHKFDRYGVQMINEVMEHFESSTDVIAVTGYAIGGRLGMQHNEGVAMRRAERVRDALIAAGVPAQRILIEGFWSDTVVTLDHPPRSATLQLKRLSI